MLGEQWREEVFETGARVVINAPSANVFDDAKPTRILFYATPNAAAKEYLPSAYLENPAIFPPAETLAKCETQTFPGQEAVRKIDSAWTRIKASG